MMLEHFRLLAGFNRWANGRVYDAAAALGEADYCKTRACAFFGSIHGTLNHLLVVDLLWFGRLVGAVRRSRAWTRSSTTISRPCARPGKPKTSA